MSKLNKSEQELDYYKNEFLRQLSKNSSFNNIIGSTRTLKDIMYMCQRLQKPHQLFLFVVKVVQVRNLLQRLYTIIVIEK